MRRLFTFLVIASVLSCAILAAQAVLGAEQKPTEQGSAFLQWAQKPPMGWNSWDCFATTVTEAQTKAHADYMAEHLKRYGWEYVVVDIQWYEPEAKSFNYRKGAKLVMDEWGRLWPATNRFPSAASNVGFKALADYVHGKGLKFGVHLLRGIPRQAVEQNTPIKGTSHHAADIADKTSICPWNTDMYGVDMSKPGAQEYYNSVFRLFAEWGVDFVKVDDISRPVSSSAEIEAIRKAIDRTGRPMVLSLSPGETPLAEGEHVSQHANMWRISDDFWDKWPRIARTVRAPAEMDRVSRPRTFPRCGHAAARRHRYGETHHSVHQGRAIHADDVVVHRPLAADFRRRHDEDG